MFYKRMILVVSIIMTSFTVNPAIAKATRLSDDQVKQQIIDESIASYPGTCACPFNAARNGSHCGRRSAWSKAGGYAPICYKKEVSKEMIAQWQQANN